MKIKEFFESKEAIAIHCNTKEKAEKLLDAFDEAGYCWSSGSWYTDYTCWGTYKENTCYSNDKKYGHIDWYKNGKYQTVGFEEDYPNYRILEFEEIELEGTSRRQGGAIMTVKEFFENKDKIVVHCDTEEKAKKLLEGFDKAGHCWRDGFKYTDYTCWYVYGEDTCYDNLGRYTEIDWYKNKGYRVLEFEEIEIEDASCSEKTQSIKQEFGEGMERDKKTIEETLKRCAEFFGITNCFCTYTYEYSAKKITLYTDRPGWWIGYHGNGKTILKAALSTALQRDDIDVSFVELKEISDYVNF